MDLQKSGLAKKIAKIFGLVLLILLFAAVATVAYFYYNKYQKVLKNPEIITTQEVDWLVTNVGKLMDLPQGETPSVATVLDKEKLKDQAFFKNAENGDKILIYTNAKKAILYRPSTEKIIEIMPIVIDNSQNASSGATTQNIKVAIYNGSATAGLTSDTETKIKSQITNATVTVKDNAKKSDYKSTIVVDLAGDKSEQAKAIATAVGGEVGSLPAGEAKPDADILVIAAK